MNRTTISNFQIMTLAVGTVASAKIFMVQQQLVLISKQDAWISMLLGSILTQLSAMNILFINTESWKRFAADLFAKFRKSFGQIPAYWRNHIHIYLYMRYNKSFYRSRQDFFTDRNTCNIY